MSESPFTSSVAEPASDSETEGGNRRRTMAIAGALGAAVLGAGAFFLLGGDEAAEQEMAAPGAVPAAAAPAPATSAAALPVASKVELGRNPFKALYVAPAAAPAPTGGGSVPTTGTGTTGGSTGGTTGGGTTAGGVVVNVPSTGGVTVPQVPAAPAQPPAQDAKQQVVLLTATHVGEEHVGVFRVNGVQETVKVGATFGPSKHLLLLSLQQGPRDDQWTAVVQLGDGDPFDVVTGTPVVVQ